MRNKLHCFLVEKAMDAIDFSRLKQAVKINKFPAFGDLNRLASFIKDSHVIMQLERAILSVACLWNLMSVCWLAFLSVGRSANKGREVTLPSHYRLIFGSYEFFIHLKLRKFKLFYHVVLSEYFSLSGKIPFGETFDECSCCMGRRPSGSTPTPSTFLWNKNSSLKGHFRGVQRGS